MKHLSEEEIDKLIKQEPDITIAGYINMVSKVNQFDLGKEPILFYKGFPIENLFTLEKMRTYLYEYDHALRVYKMSYRKEDSLRVTQLEELINNYKVAINSKAINETRIEQII